jgi:hypothetical protein
MTRTRSERSNIGGSDISLTFLGEQHFEFKRHSIKSSTAGFFDIRWNIVKQ